MTPNQLSVLQQLRISTNGDALFRPSSADRTINCPGSILLCARIPKEQSSSKYALEGTAAHLVVQDALNGVRQPDEWTDRMVRIDDLNGWFVDEEMTLCTLEYLDQVRQRENERTERFVEHKLTLATLDPSDPLLAESRGTADCLVVDRPRRKLTILDLKYGKGVMVPPDSPQLKNYALMAFVSMVTDGGWDTVETVVVQPRAPDWEERKKRPPTVFTPLELMDEFLPKLVGAMEESLDPNARLVTGKWCRWCPASRAGICPAMADQALHVARDAFSASPLMTASSAMSPVPAVVHQSFSTPAVLPPNTVVLPSPLTLDPGDIATILDRKPLYDAFMQGMQHRAAQLIQAGVAVSDWAMQSRAGHRRFKDPDAAPKVLYAMGLKAVDVHTEPKLKSPRQIELLLPVDMRFMLDPAEPDSLVERPEGEPQLVRADASRAIAPPATGFTPIAAKAETKVKSD